MRAPIQPFLHALAALAIATSAQGAAIRPAPRTPAGTVDVRAATQAAPAIQFTRGLPRPPERDVPVQAPAASRAEPQDDSPHPRPRAFRSACNSTTGC
jgi:hypothetical protein